jgi:hypothetical protein
MAFSWVRVTALHLAYSSRTPMEVGHLLLGDFNGDGNLDAMVWSTQSRFFGFYMGKGDGTLLGPFQVQSGDIQAPVGILAADLNRDGISDLAVELWTPVGVSIEIRLAQGDGTFRFGGVYQVTTRNMTGLLQGDFNEDGLTDLAAITSLPAGVDIFLGNGDGSLQPPVHYPFLLAYNFTTADFNGEGHLDLLAMREAYGYGARGEWSILIGNGDGTFQPPVTHTNLLKRPWAFAAADFNQDGYADLAVTDLEDLATFPNLSKCP